MNTSHLNLFKVLSNLKIYLLKILLISLILFINSCKAGVYLSDQGQSGIPCPRISYSQVYIRDPLDCKIFYICFGKRFWKLSCPGSTIFSSKHKVCVWKKSGKDDCQTLKEENIVYSTRALLPSSKNVTENKLLNKWPKTTTFIGTTITKGVTITITKRNTAKERTNKTKLTTILNKDTGTKNLMMSTATESSNTDLVTNELSSTSLRPLLTTTRTVSPKTELKLKTKWFPSYWTKDFKHLKWWQRKTPKWWKKNKWFTKKIAKTIKPTRKVPTIPKYEMEYCGDILTSPYIIGGQPGLPGRWPWQVSLQIISAGQPWHRCGGVLVHPLWVVTAAHCVEGPFYGNLKNWHVVMAEGDLDSDSGAEVYRKLSRIVSHPGYKRASNFPNDIAMIQLDEPVDVYEGNIRMACLPPTEQTQLFGESNCWISGWGETRGSGKQNGLNELGVSIVPKKSCQSMWGRVDIDVLDQQVCVGYGETGACYGDSGGPLMCEVNGTYYLGGVMSWLINNCSAKGFPNVFTRVQSYLDWIHHNINYYHWWRYS